MVFMSPMCSCSLLGHLLKLNWQMHPVVNTYWQLFRPLLLSSLASLPLLKQCVTSEINNFATKLNTHAYASSWCTDMAIFINRVVQKQYCITLALRLYQKAEKHEWAVHIISQVLPNVTMATSAERSSLTDWRAFAVFQQAFPWHDQIHSLLLSYSAFYLPLAVVQCISHAASMLTCKT